MLMKIHKNLSGFRAWPWRLTPSGFIVIFTLVNAFLLNLPLLTYVEKNIGLTSSLGIGVQLVILGLSWISMWSILGIVSIIGISLLKFIAVTFLVLNSIALFAINTYQVVLDKAMMGNVWGTNKEEAIDLFHFSLFYYLFFAVVISIFIILYINIRHQSRLKTFIHLLIALILGLGIVFFNSTAWLWVDKNSKMIGGLMLPWSYTFNSVRFLNEQNDAERKLRNLPDLMLKASDELPVTVVLVIGESARSQNFQIYGYSRETNPDLSKKNISIIANPKACSTYTRKSLECMLSHDPEGNGLTHEVLPNYLHRSGQVEVIWRTRNSGQPALGNFRILKADQLSKICRLPDCSEPDQDEALLAELDLDILNARHPKQFIVLHQSGSHGPSYEKKYPPNFARFMPVCDSVDLKKCTPQSLMNAYDNTIIYTDFLLNKLIDMLDKINDRRIILIYVSDHGESLGEGGWYLHGAPDLLAPKEQINIPMMVWLSSVSSKNLSVRAELIHKNLFSYDYNLPNGHFQIFHSILGALGISSAVYLPERDVFKHK